MKKIILIVMITLSLLLVGGCDKKEVMTDTDAIKFKEEYESLNGESNSSGKKYREVSISSENPIVYATANDIVKKIDNKESFIVYFGFKSCPWCRSMLETLLKVAEAEKIDKVYYVDIYELRDTYTLDGDKPVKSKDGGEGYTDLLDRLKDVLSDYTLTNEKGKTIKVGEKRIYAPNIVSVVEGVAQKLTTGISDLQTDSYMDLTDEMKTEMYEKIDCVFDCLEKKACTQGC